MDVPKVRPATTAETGGADKESFQVTCARVYNCACENLGDVICVEGYDGGAIVDQQTGEETTGDNCTGIATPPIVPPIVEVEID